MKEACCFFYSHLGIAQRREKTHILKQQSSNIHASAPALHLAQQTIFEEREKTPTTQRKAGIIFPVEATAREFWTEFDGWRWRRGRGAHTHTNPLTHDDDLVYECIMNDDRCWWWWWMHTHNNRSRTNNNSRDTIIFLCARKFQVTDYTRVVCVFWVSGGCQSETVSWTYRQNRWIAIRAGLLRGLRDLRAHGNNVERELRFENGFT